MNNTKWYKSLLEKLSRRARTPLFVFLGGALLGIGFLLLIMSGALVLPMITISSSQSLGETNSFFTLEDGGLRVGENTIRISRHRLDMGNKRITNLAAPVAGTDAATRAYVDAAPSGGACYTAWGISSCAAGWTAVFSGVTTLVVHFHDTTASDATGPICATPAGSSGGTFRDPRIFQRRGPGQELTDLPCAICCR